MGQEEGDEPEADSIQGGAPTISSQDYTYEDGNQEYISYVENLSNLRTAERALLQQILQNQVDIRKYKQQAVYYGQFQLWYFSQISSKLKEFDVELVIYDEMEHFRQWNNPLFPYPYSLRKNVLNSYKFNFDNKDETNYYYFSQVIKFERSNVCLQPHWTNQMMFTEEFERSFYEVVNMVKKHFLPSNSPSNSTGNTPNTKWIDPFEDLCDGEFYRKYKFSDNHGESRLFTDYYDPQVVAEDHEVIMLELTLKQDSIKTVSERSATEILDFLGDIGGFQGALIMIFMMVGQYFSSRFFDAKIANELYIEKVDQVKD